MTSALNATESIDIEPSSLELARRVSSSLGVSTSPKGFHTPPWTMSGLQMPRASTGGLAKQLKPFATEDIKILLLENVNVTGRDLLVSQGYQVTHLKSALPEIELIEKIRWGCRSSPFGCTGSKLIVPEMFTLLAYAQRPSSQRKSFKRPRI